MLPRPETHTFAEERRLFYVALTRAKEKVYLIGERGSIFLDEITTNPNFKELIYIPQDELKPASSDVPPQWLCPKCGQGHLRKITTGLYGAFLGCSCTKKLKV